jgi:hypothetical protein
MGKTLYALTAAFAALLSLTACHGNDEDQSGDKDPPAKVYVSGLERENWDPLFSAEAKAKLWINGKATMLPNAPSDPGAPPGYRPVEVQADAVSVFVSAAGDVYAAGIELDEEWGKYESYALSEDGNYLVSREGLWRVYHATVWKNRVPQRLASKGKMDALHYGHTQAWSVFVSGDDDVYVVGDVGFYYYDVTTPGVSTSYYRGQAMLWKNGVGEALDNGGSDDVSVRSVSVSQGGDVYAAGYMVEPATLKFVAVLWKNGEMQKLSQPGAGFASAWSVFASGDDVYVAGQEGDKHYDWGTHAMLWKNGVETVLDDNPLPTIAASVFVSDGDVYVVGPGANERYNDVGILWKNGVRRDFTDGNKNSAVYSVYVHEGAWYAAGMEIDPSLGYDYQSVPVSMMWVNGSPRRLSSTDGRAASVFVTDLD